ncbi:MAG: cytochrome b, partial [Sphingomonadales bacterium]|nr:cytochrome b [Sphingomonadales bacterium]
MLANTPASYGAAARALHWLTALLIVSAIALGLYAETLPRDSEAAAATLRTIYSAHKTIGVATFFAALIRILWALSQPKPAPLHPERRAETLAAEVVHWALYGAMLIMPASGWVLHAAERGFAPILWPFGQGLPFVPKSEGLAHAAQAVHKLSALVLYGAIGLHVLGALKHALIDRDGTLARMTRGTAPGAAAIAHKGGAARTAPVVALILWA